MRIIDLINEGKWSDDFNRYRKMGQNPTDLAKHAFDKVVGTTDNKGSAQKTAAPVRTKSNLGDTSEIKSIIDRVINGQQLDNQSLQALKQFRKKL